MSQGKRSRSAAYVRAVEKAWEDLRGRAVVLSPRDWALASDWAARGVPLACVLEALREAKRRRRTPTSLTRLAPVVEEAWRVVREGRAERPLERREPQATVDPLDPWRAASRAAAPGSALRDLLDRAIALAEAGSDLADADRFVDERLADAVPTAMADEARSEADRALAPFRARMSPDVLEATRRRSVSDRLRARIGLERLGVGVDRSTDDDAS